MSPTTTPTGPFGDAQYDFRIPLPQKRSPEDCRRRGAYPGLSAPLDRALATSCPRNNLQVPE